MPTDAAPIYLTIDDDGGVVGFAADGLEGDLLASARNYPIAVSLIRVDIPLPAGSAAAKITVLQRFTPPARE
jgi:hypothetical protein